MTLYFAHETPRESQKIFMEEVYASINDNKHIFIQAPTGLGKTAAALSPAISYALKHNKKVFFLTSRYTQHVLALQTITSLNERNNLQIISSDFIAKKNMCLFPQAESLSTGEFTTFCKKLRETHQCKYFTQARKDNGMITPDAKILVEKLVSTNAQQIKDESYASGLCPYEISAEVAKRAHVIVGDYYYIFHPRIRDAFLRKIGCALEDCIVIVDEAHNLPDRIKELASAKLTSFICDQAHKEALQYALPKAAALAKCAKLALEDFNDIQSQEQVVPRSWFIQKIELEMKYEEALDVLDEAESFILEQKQRAFMTTLHDFFTRWLIESEGYTRIISKSDKYIQLSLRCLDARIMTTEVKEAVQSVIMMSGTFRPINLYADVLGFSDAKRLTFPNPFPQENALHLVVPQTTTKFTDRTKDMYEKIAKYAADITNVVPGNSIVFFPSYFIQKQIEPYFHKYAKRTVFLEYATFTKQERAAMLETFKQYKQSGAVLLAVSSGSFGEGIDLPGDLLKAVIVVGLPLGKPDLETNQLINYYDKHFGNGWDYGYVIPAFNTLLQNAGRCIRSHTDRGVIVYLDERFGTSRYLRYFPDDVTPKVSRDGVKDVLEFFMGD
jgi:DNA excision repair protein ERCC-2